MSTHKVKLLASSLRACTAKFNLAWIQQHLAWIVIAAPMALLVIYLVIFSQPRYMSESKVAVKRPSDIEASSLNVGLLLGASTSSSGEDSLYLKEYINSADMLKVLDKQLDFHDAWSHSGLDFIYHLSKDTTAEQFLNYYRDRISVVFDDKTGLLTIQTQGFTPEFSQRFNKAVLKESERFINELSHKIARDQQNFAQEELRQARVRLDKSKAELLNYQNQNNILDPEVSATAATSLVMTLQGKKVELEAELRNLLSYLREDAPQVISIRNSVKALQAQIDAEQNKITAPGDKKLNSMAADFDEIKARVTFDTEIYTMAIKAIEKTRLEAARKLKVLSVISSPQQPEESSFPRSGYLLASWLLVCCLLFGTIKLLLAVIEDHKD
ncbi:TPA: capsule biosynthesis protein [Kluyvera intermedia]|jgi:capsular polysaccharide transport system permease protein|uniref:Capsule biosynthesis protein n=2 Tax=Enterobacteriaceae TaxID=543 RepID=A0AAC8TQ52_9ENTR|nr:capsule biosynthesis protein [Phytobacter ursingii]MDU6684127.1 capsule biosynthesis protein [Enterobacteriaceae bacterium]HAT2205095.1 capsule biosynthesis protein [Kluyvera intermedia]AKL15082.1 capsule biosynthesis protein [Phytobacter ursingii]HAT2515656.1 capsule biosynthesis protein [Kluyvera intermedia]HAT2603413.1 capsule biosynthesis protein [Kluyvera intermedia]